MKKVKDIASGIGLILTVIALGALLLYAWTEQQARIDAIATQGCVDHGGVDTLRGGPQTQNGSGVSASGNPVVTSTRVDAPYYLTCVDGARGVFWEDESSVVVE
jgi:hypothetical protein